MSGIDESAATGLSRSGSQLPLSTQLSIFIQSELETRTQISSANGGRPLSEFGDLQLDSLMDCYECLEMLQRVFPVPGAGDLRNPLSLSGNLVASRYELGQLLGGGGFGDVYRARDRQLKRDVAIKIMNLGETPLESDKRTSIAMSEARTVARLKHPNIVRVFDVGSTEEIPLYIVSELIVGENLNTRAKIQPFAIREAVEVVATIANALEYSHQQDVIHRDVKPANILLDSNNVPHLADFGLAVSTSQLVNNAGTPLYMSPELLNERRHRIDPRSDIYSLGVTLYELLAGGKPFPAGNFSELSDRICRGDFLPLGLLVEGFPSELERIQKTAMAVRKSDRYHSAGEMAEDLMSFLASENRQVVNPPKRAPIVPQGLRAFSIDDANFFLELLPGARDQSGIPRGVRFWNSKIENAGFEVGVLFGPSGCGKSSFVKAGLIPNLSPEIKPIYLEASKDGTAERALQQLRQQIELPCEIQSLAEATKFLCRSSELGTTSKRFLIIFDQFEQYLHSRAQGHDPDLVAALENCDGETVMSVLMVRDDYWMELNRLMSSLDIPIVEGGNSAAVDLFDLRHAKKVLKLFGQATGDLPLEHQLSMSNLKFIDRAIEEIQQEGRVVCVRLALFLQMMQGKPWEVDVLDGLAGSSGVGVQFLEQTFGDASKVVAYREVADAAKRVLAVLLPGTGSDLKGTSRPVNEIQRLAQVNQPTWEKLVTILDKQLKLLTPVSTVKGQGDQETTTRGYQLAHDFLVPVLREWLYRKKREMPSGRAEICLAERESLWKTDRRSRFIPSLSETLAINRLTDQASWSSGEQEMMKAANRYYASRAVIALVATVVMIFAGMLIRSNLQQNRAAIEIKGKVDALMIAQPTEIIRLAEELKTYQQGAKRVLQERFSTSQSDQERLHSALGLASLGELKTEHLRDRLLRVAPDYVGLIRQHRPIFDQEFEGKLWDAIRNPNDTIEVLVAASALAYQFPNHHSWKEHSSFVAGALVQQNPLNVVKWMELLRPIQGSLRVALADILLYDIDSFAESESQIASSILQDYAADDPVLLFKLLKESAPENFVGFFSAFSSHKEDAVELVTKELSVYDPQEQLIGPEKLDIAKRRSNVCLMALKLREFDAMSPYLQNSRDNSVRTEIIHSVNQAAVEGRYLINLLNEETDSELRASLLFCLGELCDRLDNEQRDELSQLAMSWYREEADAGVHSVCDWLLSNRLEPNGWNDTKSEIDTTMSTGRIEEDRRWYCTKNEGFTFTVVHAPSEFQMGSTPETMPDRDMDELRRERLIPRSFAISQLEVSVGQFRKFWLERPKLQEFYTYPDETYSEENSAISAGRINFYLAAEYCNWLSAQEGIPEDQWCFPKKIDRTQGIKIPADYYKRTGYRLLSETEWEYACRNGTLTPWHFGSNIQHLAKFGWWSENSNDRLHSRGELKPNRLGLFDVYGNALEWTANGQPLDATPISIPGRMGYEDSKLLVYEVKDDITFILRGGSVESPGRYARSSYRNGFTPDSGGIVQGFRIGRTLPR